MTALGILPGAAYVIYGVFIAGYLGQQFGGRFIPSLFSQSILLSRLGQYAQPRHRRRDSDDRTARPLLFGKRKSCASFSRLWAGYALFGLYFNYHISTHDYYSLPLIPIAALSLAPAGRLVLRATHQTHDNSLVYVLLFTFYFSSASSCLFGAPAPS